MKSIYDKKGLPTAESQKFGVKIEEAVQPVLDEYLAKGFSVRDLSHEAQAIIMSCELDHMITIHMADAAKTRKNLKKKSEAKKEVV